MSATNYTLIADTESKDSISSSDNVEATAQATKILVHPASHKSIPIKLTYHLPPTMALCDARIYGTTFAHRLYVLYLFIESLAHKIGKVNLFIVKNLFETFQKVLQRKKQKFFYFFGT